MSQASVMTIEAFACLSSDSNPHINLSLCKRELRDDDVSIALNRLLLDYTSSKHTSCGYSSITLDLSRNFLKHTIPPQVFQTPFLSQFPQLNLTSLNVSRNSLRSLPPAIENLKSLVELHALANNFRLRLLPIVELASLPALRLLDLRYNPKLKQTAHTALTEALSASGDVEVRCTVPATNNTSDNRNNTAMTKLSACDRDATLLRSQLEPLSTPQLRKRLERTFGVDFIHQDEGNVMDAEEALQFNREYVMEQLLECYHTTPNSRQVRYERGSPVRPELLEDILAELKALDWSNKTRERPKIKAQHYMILQRPNAAGQIDSARTRRETAKLTKYRAIYDVAVQALTETDPHFANNRFTALAVTKNFAGSPHIDTLNTAPFYGLSLGDFSPQDGGKIAVECSATLVAEVDTRNRLAKVDGRFPHWVTPYHSGNRYSLIYYATSGDVVPQTTAIFERPPSPGAEAPLEAWVPPPLFVP